MSFLSFFRATNKQHKSGHKPAIPVLAPGKPLPLKSVSVLILCVLLFGVCCFVASYLSHSHSNKGAALPEWRAASRRVIAAAPQFNPQTDDSKHADSHNASTDENKSITKRLNSQSRVFEAAVLPQSLSLQHTAKLVTNLQVGHVYLLEGEMVKATLETAINSDFAGLVRAIVAEPVYSFRGNKSLIASGSRLVGHYLSAKAQGQNRIFIIWDRVMTPAGKIISLKSPGTDDQGRTGLAADTVNTHFWQRFSQAALLSVLGAGAAWPQSDNAGVNSSWQQYQASLSSSLQNQAGQSWQQATPMKPTLTVIPGTPINVFVAHDIDFSHV